MANQPIYADFDAAFAEQDAPPVVVRLFGEDWPMPATMPSTFMLKVARWMEEGRAADELTTAEVYLLAADIIPADTLNAWEAKGLGHDRLEQVITFLIATYTQQLPAATEDQVGNGEAPTTPGFSFSSVGASSQPTSDESTGSSSPGNW